MPFVSRPESLLRNRSSVVSRTAMRRETWTALPWGLLPYDACLQRKRPTPGLPDPAVQHLQAFSASWRFAPPDTRPTLFHVGGACGVSPSEVFPPMRPIGPLGRSSPPDVVLQVDRSASSPVVVRKRATSFPEVTLSVRRRSGAFRRQKLRTGDAVPALGCFAQFPLAPCGTCGGRATSPVANARVHLTTPSWHHRSSVWPASRPLFRLTIPSGVLVIGHSSAGLVSPLTTVV